MPYSNNIALAVAAKLENCLKDDPLRTSFFQKQITRRGACVIFACTTGSACAVDTIIGMGAATAALLTFGKLPKLSKFAFSHLASSTTLGGFPYIGLLSALNFESLPIEGGNVKEPFFGKPLIKAAEDYAKSTHWAKRQISSRFTYALFALTSLVTRVAQIILALITVPLAFLSLGKFKAMNAFALQNIQASCLIYELFMCAHKIVNPQAAVDYL